MCLTSVTFLEVRATTLGGIELEVEAEEEAEEEEAEEEEAEEEAEELARADLKPELTKRSQIQGLLGL